MVHLTSNAAAMTSTETDQEAGSQLQSGSAQPSLVLHLDVNKTLILVDAAAGSSIGEIINSTLAASAFGSVCTGSDGVLRWTALSDDLHVPTAEKRDALEQSRLCTFAYFARELLLPYLDTKVAPDGAMLTAEQRAQTVQKNLVIRRERKLLIDNFTEVGQPGVRFRHHFNALLSKLTIEIGVHAKCRHIKPIRNGFRFLLPSYVELLRHLVTSGRRFLVVFRTFGHDLMDVIDEHNAFCAGQHPLYPLPADERLRESYSRLAVSCPDATGSFVRSGDHAADTRLSCVLTHRHGIVPTVTSGQSSDVMCPVHGTTAAASSGSATGSIAGDQQHKDRIANSGPSGSGLPHVGTLAGYREIYNHILSKLPTACTCNTSSSAQNECHDVHVGSNSKSTPSIATPVATGSVPAALQFTSNTSSTSISKPAAGCGSTLALHDHYEYWFASGEKGHAGKLLPFDPTDPDIHSIFFDDNCGSYADKVVILDPDAGERQVLGAAKANPGPADAAGGCIQVGSIPASASSASASGADAAARAAAAHEPSTATERVHIHDESTDDPEDCGIVDARDVHTGHSLDWSSVRNRYLVRVDPLSAALNDQYFVQVLRACEVNRADELAKCKPAR